MHRLNTKRFIILSLILHIIFVLLIGKETIKEKKLFDPLRIRILEEAKKPKGVIEELPKPFKIEEPKEAKILSEYSSKAHYDLSEKKSDKPGVEKPFGLSPKSASKAVSKEAQKPKIEIETRDKKVAQKSKPKSIVAKLKEEKGDKKITSQEKTVKEEKPETGREALLRKKEKKSPERGEIARRSLQGLPLLSSDDLEKYTEIRPGSRGEGSDGVTVSLDTKEFKYISYFAGIKRKIELIWSYPIEAQQQNMYGYLYLKFTIRRDGSLEKVDLIKSSGYKILDDEAINAIKTAAPYNPIPERIKGKNLTIEASFHYLPRVLYVR